MKVDIISQQEIKSGKAYRVKEDPILETIAKIKKKLNTYQGNELYVSEESLEKYRELRENFEKSLQIFVVAVVVLVIVLIVFPFPLLNGMWGSVLNGILLTLVLSFIMFALVLKSYMPAIEETPEIIGGEEDGEQDRDQSEP